MVRLRVGGTSTIGSMFESKNGNQWMLSTGFFEGRTTTIRPERGQGSSEESTLPTLRGRGANLLAGSRTLFDCESVTFE
jgi:hypothetical protein